MLMRWSFLYLSMWAAWVNYNLSLKTLDGKRNLHVTVGIVYQNVSSENSSSSHEIEPVICWPHRISKGALKLIPRFLTNIKRAKFVFTDKNMDRYREISSENVAEDGETKKIQLNTCIEKDETQSKQFTNSVYQTIWPVIDEGYQWHHPRLLPRWCKTRRHTTWNLPFFVESHIFQRQ